MRRRSTANGFNTPVSTFIFTVDDNTVIQCPVVPYGNVVIDWGGWYSGCNW